jgi:uncharacterized membrane protein YjjB (DUF3815 family)
MLENVELVILSFFASLGFGIVFQIRKSDLVYAGLGGAITRIVYLIFMAFIPYRIVYVGLAAFCASIYAEIMANHKKMPATVFLYPSIVPLIPGDLFYYTMGGIVLSNEELFRNNAVECLLALVGISIGFVISSSALHYIRQKKL